MKGAAEQLLGGEGIAALKIAMVDAIHQHVEELAIQRNGGSRVQIALIDENGFLREDVGLDRGRL